MPAIAIDAISAEKRISRHVRETSLSHSRWLSDYAHAEVYLKLENLQDTGAFKLRGAANKLLSLTPTQARQGVVTASNGNHALAVATMGRKLGIATEVFVSEHIDPARRRKIEALDARVRQVHSDYLAAEQAARHEAERSGRLYVSPYNDADVIAGQGTIAVELLRQLPQSETTPPRLDAVFIAVGGGGLISGIGSHLKMASSATEIVGCWPVHSPVLYECLRAGQIIEVEENPTLSVSTAGGVEPGSITFELARQVIDRSVLVGEQEILEALRHLYREDSQLGEGAAGVAAASFCKVAADYAGKTVTIVICGGNADPGLVDAITAS